MSVFYNALRRDPIQRDPIYDALDAWIREEPPVKTYGSGPFWGLIAYGDSKLRTAQAEIAQPPATRIITPPALSPDALPPSELRLAPYPAVPQKESRLISAMKIVLLASALAFASVSLSPAFADAIGTEVEKSVHLSDRATLAISEAQIARFKSALKLTPAQERLWAPIEAELRQITHTGQRSESEGIVQRIRSRFRTIVLDVAALRRLGHVAQPLLISLDDEQKQRALQVARTMGMSSLASVF